jgi:hypothetical protein
MGGKKGKTTPSSKEEHLAFVLLKQEHLAFAARLILDGFDR